jgi:hypothetical protein
VNHLALGHARRHDVARRHEHLGKHPARRARIGDDHIVASRGRVGDGRDRQRGLRRLRAQHRGVLRDGVALLRPALHRVGEERDLRLPQRLQEEEREGGVGRQAGTRHDDRFV